jgi:hypothetical protein
MGRIRLSDHIADRSILISQIGRHDSRLAGGRRCVKMIEAD